MIRLSPTRIWFRMVIAPGVVIEPWLTDQWYVDAKTLAAPALAAVRDGKTKFHSRKIGKRPISIGSKTSSHGAFHVSSGGAIKSQPGMDQNSRCQECFSR